MQITDDIKTLIQHTLPKADIKYLFKHLLLTVDIKYHTAHTTNRSPKILLYHMLITYDMQCL